MVLIALKVVVGICYVAIILGIISLLLYVAWFVSNFTSKDSVIKGEHTMPRINEKVKIGDRYGIITKVFEPNEYHSGRFIVHIHENNYEHDSEFWFTDYGASVVPIQKL